MILRADTPEVGAVELRLREVLRQVRPDESKLFPELVDNYEEYHRHVETGQLLRARLIAPWIDTGSTVLDAGCGDGLMAEFLTRERAARVRGFDLAAAAVEKTRSRGIPAETRDLDAAPEMPDGFDYILFVEVLEHLRFPHRVLRSASQHARKAVIVTIPNSAWFLYRLQLLLGHSPVQSFTHLHFWGHRDFTAFCRRLGVRSPELRVATSSVGWRRAIIGRWPNLFAQQLAYRIPRDARI